MKELVIQHLQSALPSLRAVYLFGSVVTEYFTDDSDIDVAVLTGIPVVPNPQRRPKTYFGSYSADRANLW